MVHGGAVIGVAAVASYEHAYALVRAHGETGWIGRLVPLTVDGLIYASSMVLLDSARRDAQAEQPPRAEPGITIELASISPSTVSGTSRPIQPVSPCARTRA